MGLVFEVTFAKQNSGLPTSSQEHCAFPGHSLKRFGTPHFVKVLVMPWPTFHNKQCTFLSILFFSYKKMNKHFSSYCRWKMTPNLMNMVKILQSTWNVKKFYFVQSIKSKKCHVPKLNVFKNYFIDIQSMYE